MMCSFTERIWKKKEGQIQQKSIYCLSATIDVKRIVPILLLNVW